MNGFRDISETLRRLPGRNDNGGENVLNIPDEKTGASGASDVM